MLNETAPIIAKKGSFSSREEIIWASGLFEGEGWFTIQKNTPMMGMQLSDKDLLIKLQRVFGRGNIYFRPPRIYSYEIIKSRKPQWAWRVTGFENVQALVGYMWQWLGPRRRQRAKEILEISKSSKNRLKFRGRNETKRARSKGCGSSIVEQIDLSSSGSSSIS